MDGRLCAGIQTPPPLDVPPPLSGKAPPLIQKYFNPPSLFEILARISNPAFRKGGCPLCNVYKTDIDREKELEQKNKSNKYFYFLSFFTIFLKFYTATIFDI